ncbi:hypothetical protein PoB_002041900 [Plakobranchus ocellatus]|uniref:G-protein coupled receptors family 1 profile domain-containing protein n=1 Tax=Plakobranchus ocellatus TaxID=259542 RepID=A0AAV3ZEW5_9GAST|nr:hypothetical protein PoB_002041900 [Plakobranchus ocellatus]
MNSLSTTNPAYVTTHRPLEDLEKDGQLRGLVDIKSEPWGFACLLLLALWIFAMLGNILVMVVIQRSRRVQSTTNFFVISLAAGDVVFLLVAAPLVAAHILLSRGHWSAGDSLCRLTRFVQFSCMASTNLVLVGVCVDRFYTILYPLSFKVTRGTAKRLILCAWAVSVFFSAPAFYFFQTEKIRGHVQRFETSSSSAAVCPTFIPASHNAGLVYAVICLITHYVCPLILLLVGYSRIFCHIRTVHLHARNCGRRENEDCGASFPGNKYRTTCSSLENQAQQNNHSNINHIVDNDQSHNVMPIHQRSALSSLAPHSYSTPSPCGQHNPVPRAKVKMVRMLAWLTLTTFLLQLPYYLSHAAYSLNRHRYLTADAFLVSFWLLTTSAALKPVIYAYSNSNFWRGCKEMLCMSTMRCYRLNNYTITSATAMSKRNYVGVMDVSKEQDIDVRVNAAGLAFNRNKVIDRTAWPIGGSALPSSWL